MKAIIGTLMVIIAMIIAIAFTIALSVTYNSYMLIGIGAGIVLGIIGYSILEN